MSYNNQYGNPYTQAPSAEAGYGFRYEDSNHPQHEQHEMQPINNGQQGYQQQQQQQYDGHQTPAAPAAMPQNDFLGQVQFTRGEIRKLTADVQSIAGLHSRSLHGDDQAQRSLEDLIQGTTVRNTQIRSQIKTLKSDVERTHDAGLHGLKKRQWTSLNDEFKAELQGYLQEEQRYKEGYREQIARQYRIANPDASEDEVRNASNQDWSDQGVFQQALSTNRLAQGQAALGAVRQRHQQMKEIEQRVSELAALFQDLDTLVIQQEPVVARAEEQTEVAVQHLKGGNEEVKKSVTLAIHRRKLKWWCVLVVILILIAIGVGVGVGVAVANGTLGGNKKP